MNASTSAAPSASRARRAVSDPAWAVRQASDAVVSAVRARKWMRDADRHPAPAASLAPRDALRRNGFVVHRALIPADECARLAAQLKADVGITEGTEFTRTDATNKVPRTRSVLFDQRILQAVQSMFDAPMRFLQTSDLHYLHDTVGWHRDSVHRAADNSASADWRADGPTYAIVKAILYLESDNAAMGMMPGSHLSPAEVDIPTVRAVERWGGHRVVDVDDDPHQAVSAEQQKVPSAWRSMPGDVLIFDQRMYHCGRRIDDGKVNDRTDSAKLTVSFVFGVDNVHSERFYSYFRYVRREIGYLDFSPEFRQELVDHDLLLSSGTANYYEQHPQELRLAHLRKPETLDDLIAEFTRRGQAAG